jgi:hypothetical protein
MAALAIIDTPNVTYSEIRSWAVWLHTFTASDLADAMGVDLYWGQRGIKALLWHGICEGTGEFLDGPDGPEEIISYKPLPPGPNEHPHGPLPEVIAVVQMGGFEILSPRGQAVRIRTERQMRRSLSTPGARQHHRNRERAWERAEQAKMERAEQQRLKARQEAESGGPRRAGAKRAKRTAAQDANAAVVSHLNLEKLRRRAARNAT